MKFTKAAGGRLIETAPLRGRDEFLGRAVVVRVVGLLLAGEGHHRAVMEIVVPERVESVAAAPGRAHEPRVLGLVFRHDDGGASARRRPYLAGESGQEMVGGVVVYALGRVEAEAVEVEFLDPGARIGEEELAHGRRARPVEVERLAPVRPVPVREVVRREVLQVVAVRSQMVVDDVEDDREPVPVGVVHEAAQIVGLAVEMGRSEEIDAVISPAKLPGELADGHDLHARHAQARELPELAHGSRPVARGSERAHVHLVDHLTPEGRARPLPVGPGERARIHHHRRTGWALRLESRSGIRIQRVVLVEAEPIPRTGAGVERGAGEVAVSLGRQRHRLPCPLVAHHHRNPAPLRRPDAKMHTTITQAFCPDGEPAPWRGDTRNRAARSRDGPARPWRVWMGHRLRHRGKLCLARLCASHGSR